MPSPINPTNLSASLQDSNYDSEKVAYLIQGFTTGFALGHYSLPINTEPVNSHNISGKERIVQEKILAEIKLGRMSGPYKKPPFIPFQISPVNIIQKKDTSKFRFLHNLSSPYNGDSINDHIMQSDKSVQYSSIGDAIKIILAHDIGAYLCKTDITDAFRLIPIRPQDYPKLGIKFNNLYYHDKVLPQGCGSSCKIFTEFSTALKHIHTSSSISNTCIHLLDDFLFINNSRKSNEQSLNKFQEICKFIGVPLSDRKTTQPNTTCTFLGIELDTIEQCARLPKDKLSSYVSDIKSIMEKTFLTKREMQSIIGKLSFAASVVPARPFLRRLITSILGKSHPNDLIYITPSIMKDLNAWLLFLSQFNGVSYFRALGILDSRRENICSDASHLGFGATFQNLWIQAKYPIDWKKFHITFLELYPLLVLLNVFQDNLKNKSVLFHCDNIAVVHIINNQSSRDGTIMGLFRRIVISLMKLNIHLRAQHVPGIDNVLCDRISRFQDTPDLLLKYGMNLTGTRIPTHLMPLSYEPL